MEVNKEETITTTNNIEREANMPVRRKETIAPKETKKSKNETPTLSVNEIIPEQRENLIQLHSNIRRKKALEDSVKSDPAKAELIDIAKERMFKDGDNKSFYVDLHDDGKQLLVKPNTRRWPVTEDQIGKIEKVIEDAGYDAGDYYHESHQIKINADKIHDRLGEENYYTFQAELAAFMAEHKVSDCFSQLVEFMPKTDFHTSRLALPCEVNMGIEKIKPTTVSIETKLK